MNKPLLILILLAAIYTFSSCGVTGTGGIETETDTTDTTEVTASACGETTEETTGAIKMTYTNPIYESDTADPHIIKHDGVYYIFATGGKIIKSTDLINWQPVYGGMRINPGWGTPGAGFWAPDVVKIGDKFIVYYSLSVWDDKNPGIGTASADHPEGPWTDHGKLFLSKEIGVENSIDPAVFTARDGKIYMVWGSFRGVYMAELSSDGLSLAGGIEAAKKDKILIAGKDYGYWEGSTFEAPYVIYKDGYYYLFASSGTCCEGLNSTYHVKVGRSASPTGPYTDSAGRNMTGRNVGHLVIKSSKDFVGPGHNSIVIDDNGDYYLVYHVWKRVMEDGKATGKGRWLAIDKLIWSDDGWCEVEGKTPSASAEYPVVK